MAKNFRFSVFVGFFVGLGLQPGLSMASCPTEDDVVFITAGVPYWWYDTDLDGAIESFVQQGLSSDQFLAGEPLVQFQDNNDELVAFREGTWYVRRSNGMLHDPDPPLAFGLPGDRALILRFSSAFDQGAVKRGDSLFVDRNSNLRYDGASDTEFNWPVSLGTDDYLLAGDVLANTFDSDELIVWRGDTATWEFYRFDLSVQSSTPNASISQFGLPGDIPFVGDINGDGRDDLLLYRAGPDFDWVMIRFWMPGRGNHGYGTSVFEDQRVDYTAAFGAGVYIAAVAMNIDGNIAGPDTDGDGILDCTDNCDDVVNTSQVDQDGDGVGDACDGCPANPNKTGPGQCGCAVPDTDSDSDGTADCNDGCPMTPGVVTPPTWYWDVDNDGYGDPAFSLESCTQPSGYVSNDDDACPGNPDLHLPALCGCSGTGDDDIDDVDHDGVCNLWDNCRDTPNASQQDVDADGIGDACDACTPGDCPTPGLLLAGRYPVGSGPADLAISRWSGGVVSIVTADREGDTVTIFDVSPSLSLVRSQTFVAGIAPCSVDWGLASAGDALDDVVVASQSGIFSIVNNGDGTYTSNYSTGGIPILEGNRVFVAFSDVNAGGTKDVVSLGIDALSLASIGTRLGDGGSSGIDDQHPNPQMTQVDLELALGADYGPPALFRFWQNIASDVDTGIDLAIPRPTAGVVSIFPTLGNSIDPDPFCGSNPEGPICVVFRGWAHTEDIEVGSGPLVVRAGRLGGISDLDDLVVVNALSNTISVILDSNPDPYYRRDIDVGLLPTAAAIGDLNRDGLQDVAVVNASSNELSVILNRGNDVFENVGSVLLPGGSEPRDIELLDTNEDGEIDFLFIAARGRDEVLLYLNNLDGVIDDCNDNGMLDSFEITSGAGSDCNTNLIPDDCESPGLFVGDVNCDCRVNGLDIQATVDAMISPALFEARYGCDISQADLNLNGAIDPGDTDVLVALLTGD